jgi:hypothetical protein
MVAKWPGVIEPGVIVNEIMAHEDWLPTLLAAVGDPDIKDELLTGHQFGDKTFYFSDNANLMAVRYNAWKLNFKTIVGNLFTGKEDSTNVPVETNLRQDPWERYQTEGMLYGRWWGEKLWTMVPAINIVGEFLATFVAAYPPSQASGTLSVEKALTMLQEGTLKN